METLTKAQLLAEIESMPVPDDAPVLINIGRQNYEIETVISGNGNIYLETNANIGRPQKFANDQERYAFHNAKRKKKAE